MNTYCFLNMSRVCGETCTAYLRDDKTNCRLLGAIERLIPPPRRPTAPTMPIKSK